MIRLVLRVVVVLAVIPLLLAVLYNVVNPVSTLMIGRWITGERVERVWTPIEKMSPALVRTVIASEDASFCHNIGIDIAELREAIEKADDLEDTRGASTIPMQIAKNLFLWPGRALIRKAIEMPLAIWLDLVVSKRRLIEIYLNIAEWGPNGEFGVQAGAERAFGVPAAQVDARQAALLAVMLPNPHRRDAGNPTAGVQRLAARLQARVPKEGPELVACLGPLR
ncbi:biosynthetic peptidoglycan transglycosylase [Xanthobacter sp. 126]|uniref:biosynthetic peptidoglycan transglycosylase n=1 Tax=Xanthobacter sp. 126 TaxID=1131814 RepID=UPI0004A606CD|nr:biosynthetic peptidoglycan transglycosylase [Xanthobacter sp. 126]